MIYRIKYKKEKPITTKFIIFKNHKDFVFIL